MDIVKAIFSLRNNGLGVKCDETFLKRCALCLFFPCKNLQGVLQATKFLGGGAVAKKPKKVKDSEEF